MGTALSKIMHKCYINRMRESALDVKGIGREFGTHKNWPSPSWKVDE
jgi:hypothetical protein